ncbi:MAG: diguanylate cyclase domain-containing protein [Burkholderiaceae bacterium]
MGITLFSNHKFSIDELLKQADIAMYQAKAEGRNALCFFNAEASSSVAAH